MKTMGIGLAWVVGMVVFRSSTASAQLSTSGPVTSVSAQQSHFVFKLAPNPGIAVQPAGITVIEGDDATLSVLGTGTQPIQYQWYFNDAPIPAATGASLALTDVEMTQDGYYKVKLVNSKGNITSEIVRIRVLPAFSLGVAGAEGRNTSSGGNIVSTKYIGSTLNYSSWLGQTSADGFNCVRSYLPDVWMSRTNMKQLLQLVGNNDMKILIDEDSFYKPFDPGDGGYNQYELDGNTMPHAFLNYDSLYEEVYSQEPWKNYMWGHFIGGESNYFHWLPYDHRPCDFFATVPYCGGSTSNPLSADWEYVEVPPQNLSDAIGYFRTKQNSLGIKQNLLQGQAVHGGEISFSATDPEGIYSVSDYVTLNGVNNKDFGDVFLEGSYFTTGFSDFLNNDNYLGKFKSIEFAKQYYKRIIAEVDIETGQGGANPLWIYDYHTNLGIRNANQAWFQAYTSIIHGVEGVWLYGLPDSYEYNVAEDDANKAYMENPANPDRYAFTYFPKHYKLFVSNLGRELRYLINNRLISNDPNSVVATKTDQTDLYCILPPSSSYLPPLLTASNAFDLFTYNGWSSSSTFVNPNMSEQFGLRYTIRTNGEEVIMIVSNSSPVVISNVTLSFDGISNPIIRNSIGVDVLFQDTNEPVAGATYKTNRDGYVDLPNNFVGKSFFLPFTGNRQLNLSFGPLDVRVLKFRPDSSYTIGGFDNGWSRVWSNEGSGSVGGWGISATDKFVVGDFHKTGGEQMLCIQGNNNINSWALILNYSEGLWHWGWSNYGSGTIDGWGIRAADKFFAGDFDGDGFRNELLCVQGDGSFATILRYNTTTNDFDWYWSNSGNGSMSSGTPGLWTLSNSDKFVVGDFNNDGKRNDLLCVQSGGTGWALLNFNATFPGNFQAIQSGSGSFGSAAIWSIGANDQFLNANFDGNAKANELLCIERGSGLKAAWIRYANGAWSAVWTNGTGGPIGGWGSPVHAEDKILVGNLDKDSKDEMMFLQRCGPCSWATTQDFNLATKQPVYHWSNHNYTGQQQDYIDDWYLSEPGTTDKEFFFVKPSKSGKRYLVALKRYSCNRFLMNMYQAEPGTGDY